MESNSSLKLYGTRQSLYVQRVQLALKLKGLEYEFVEEDLANKSPELLRYNPVYKKVPVLLHGDRPVCESFIILEYIDETWKGGYPLFPEDPHERAVIRFWNHFQIDKMGPLLFKVLGTTGDEQKQAIQEYREAVKLVEDEKRDGYFKGRRFYGGDTLGVLDLLFGCGSAFFEALDELAGIKLSDPESFPHLWAWLHDFNDHELVKEVLPPKEETKERMKAYLAKILAIPDPATD